MIDLEKRFENKDCQIVNFYHKITRNSRILIPCLK